MPNISFQPTLRKIKEVLNDDFFEIPRFQRPYSWSAENLQDFWRDVVLDNDEGYFIGPMVAYANGQRTGIVDGQQRITSITLALCALRDLFVETKADDWAKAITRYIERTDDDDRGHFVLTSQAVGAFLQTQFQATGDRPLRAAASDEERSLQRAFAGIKGWLEEQIEGLSRLRREDGSNSEAALRLRQIRDRILGLQVIWIRLDSEDDAYIIFETLNSRGKDLEVVDLLKNLLLQKIRAENGDLDTARLTWSDMRRVLDEEGAGVNPNKYILHWWLSRFEYTEVFSPGSVCS